MNMKRSVVLMLTRVVLMGIVGLFAFGAAAAEAYTVGTVAPPFGIVDADTGEVEGYSVDLMSAVAEDAGFDIEIVVAENFGDYLQGLLNGRFDIGAGPVTMTPERDERLEATDAVFVRWQDALLVPASDTTDYASVEDLAGKTVGSVDRTIYLASLRERSDLYEDVVAASSFYDGAERLRSGAVDAFLTASFIIGYEHSRGNYTDLRIVDGYDPMHVAAGAIVVQEDDVQLLDRINSSLEKLIADGAVAALAEKWGITPP